MSNPMSSQPDDVLDRILNQHLDILNVETNINGQKYYKFDVAPLKAAIKALIAEQVREARIKDIERILEAGGDEKWDSSMAGACGEVAKIYKELTQPKGNNGQ